MATQKRKRERERKRETTIFDIFGMSKKFRREKIKIKKWFGIN